MSKPDTSREAVEMRAQQHDGTSAIVPGLLRAWYRETADLLRALVDERDAAIAARNEAIRQLGAAARKAGSWQGISEGKDIATRQLEAERDDAMTSCWGAPEYLPDGNPDAARCWPMARAAIAKVKGGDQ